MNKFMMIGLLITTLAMMSCPFVIAVHCQKPWIDWYIYGATLPWGVFLWWTGISAAKDYGKLMGMKTALTAMGK